MQLSLTLFGFSRKRTFVRIAPRLHRQHRVCKHISLPPRIALQQPEASPDLPYDCGGFEYIRIALRTASKGPVRPNAGLMPSIEHACDRQVTDTQVIHTRCNQLKAFKCVCLLHIIRSELHGAPIGAPDVLSE